MKIKFLPQNIEVEGSPDKTLLQIAIDNKVEIRSICKGVLTCAECRVRIVEGENNVLPPTKAELSMIGTSHFIDGRRLSCQVRCFGDVTVDLTEQLEKSANQTKKIRGFRTSKNMDSKAVNDTMLLVETPQDMKENTRESRTNVKDSENDSHDRQRSQDRRGNKDSQESREGQAPQQESRQQQNSDKNVKGPRENRRHHHRKGSKDKGRPRSS